MAVRPLSRHLAKRSSRVGAVLVVLVALLLPASRADADHRPWADGGWIDFAMMVGPGYPGQLRVAGWAATADAPTSSLAVRVLIVDTFGPLDAYSDIANGYRPDVPNAIGSHYTPYLGFDFIVAVPPVGSRTVCVQARNPVDGHWSNLNGCTAVNFNSGHIPEEKFVFPEFYSTRSTRNLSVSFPERTGYHTAITGTRGAAIVNGMTGADTANSANRIDTFVAALASANVTVVEGPAGTPLSRIAWVSRLETTCGVWIYESAGLLRDPTLLGCHVLKATIRVNPASFPGGAVGRRTIIHEVGHVVGLAHSNSLSSIMLSVPTVNDFSSYDRDKLQWLFR